MNQNKFLLGGLLGTLTMYLLGALIYGQFVQRMIVSNSISGASKAPVDIIYIIIGHLFISFLVAYIFECWAGIRSFSGGIMGGAIIGFLSVAGNMLIAYGKSSAINLTGVMIDIIAATVIVTLAGGVIGWFLGYNRIGY
jgi:hypothetical protein